MKAKRKYMKVAALINYLDKPERFDVVQSYCPNLDLDIAIDLLHDPKNPYHKDTAQFLGDVINHIKKVETPTKKNKTAIDEAKIDLEKKSLGFTAMGLAAKFTVFASKTAVKAGIQTAPNMAMGLTAFAYLLGNVPEEPKLPSSVMTICQTYATACQDVSDLERLSVRDQTLFAAMMETSVNEDEKEAIHAVGVAAAKTGVDLGLMLVFAQLESSLGKLLSADTSSAQGIFQYTEQTWLESFKRHADSYEGENAEFYRHLADKIYFDGEDYQVRGNGAETKILYLRTDDPEFHSHIQAMDMQDKDDQVLSNAWDAPDRFDERREIQSIADSLNMGRVADFMIQFWNEIHDLPTVAEEDALLEQEVLATKARTLVDFTTDIYLDHFLGRTGAARFRDVFHDIESDDRHLPVLSLVSTRTPVSNWAINSNPDLFENGNRTTAEIHDEIKSRVEASFKMMDNRLSDYLSSGAQLRRLINSTLPTPSQANRI